jgi:hypothetical protein
MGGYFTNSALMLGCAQLLVLSIAMGQGAAAAVLRTALIVAVILNAVTLGLLVNDVRAALAPVYTPGALGRLGALTLGGGLLAPLVLLAIGGPLLSVIAVLLLVLGAWVVRREAVYFPHRQTGHA